MWASLTISELLIKIYSNCLHWCHGRPTFFVAFALADKSRSVEQKIYIVNSSSIQLKIECLTFITLYTWFRHKHFQLEHVDSVIFCVLLSTNINWNKLSFFWVLIYYQYYIHLKSSLFVRNVSASNRPAFKLFDQRVFSHRIPTQVNSIHGYNQLGSFVFDWINNSLH